MNKEFKFKGGISNTEISETMVYSAANPSNYQKIQLIKWYRDLTNAGLKDAKDAIEAVEMQVDRLNRQPLMVQMFKDAAIKNGQYVPPKADAPFVVGLITEALEHYEAMQYNTYEQFLEDYLRNVRAKGGFEQLAKDRFLMEHSL